MTPEQLAASGTEHGHQMAVFQWCALNRATYPETRKLFAIPNGGLRHKATAAKMKAEGAKAGVYDMMLPVARQGFHGLFVELKTPERKTLKNGGRTDEQIKFAADVEAEGYATAVAYGWFEAVSVLSAYLGWR